MRRFRKELEECDAAPDAPSRIGNNRWHCNDARPAATIVQWINATRFIKNLSNHREAALAWAQLFCSGDLIESVDDILPTEYQTNTETHRAARVRTDVVAMVTFRLLWPQLKSPAIYLWTDSSPQWRGLEFCASTMEVMDCGELARKKLPGLSLCRGRTSAVHKCLGLLWQCMLMTGPERLQGLCRSVRAIVTDMGTERLLARMPIAVLQGLFRCVGCRTFVVTDSPFVFPSALLVPGWKHLWDLLTRKGLWQMPWMPVFIKRIKEITKFLRDDFVALADDLEGRGFNHLAIFLQPYTMPTFANWRWATLDDCCSILQKFVVSLSHRFNPKIFAKSRDPIRLNLMVEALEDPSFQLQLKVVGWYCNITTDLLKWGGSCRCHGPESSREERQQCPWKGKLLAEAFPHAMNTLRTALAEVESWTLGDVGGDVVFCDRLRQPCDALGSSPKTSSNFWTRCHGCSRGWISRVSKTVALLRGRKLARQSTIQ